jgi:hypothetical protein
MSYWGKPGRQVLWAAQDQGQGLAVRLGRSARALRLATISPRIASTAPSRPFGAPRARPDCDPHRAAAAGPEPGASPPPTSTRSPRASSSLAAHRPSSSTSPTTTDEVFTRELALIVWHGAFRRLTG